MKPFVAKDSIVREIWGNGDTILLIFAGSAAEFALNKAVDWLFYTGKLPADPLGRLFSTVAYARKIVLSNENKAVKIITHMGDIHTRLEEKRRQKIPQWAYRDVLYMLIDYSIRAYEVLQRTLSTNEKEEVFEVFHRVGTGMHIEGLPNDYSSFLSSRKSHLADDLQYSDYTRHLFNQYRLHLGTPRYLILKQAQKLVLPERVKLLLGYSRFSLLAPAVPPYKLLKKLGLEWEIKKLILPNRYLKDIRDLDLEDKR